MKKIRIMIVDDSVVIRRMLSMVLEQDSEIEVAGIAVNGEIALARVDEIKPDLITLDVDMPVMGGLETLRILRKTHPGLPVIMFSSLTERGSAAALDALALGASDYVNKPANVGGVVAAMGCISEALIPKIKALCRRAPESFVEPPTRADRLAIQGPATPGHATQGHVDVLAIGVSAGGPSALASLLPRLDRDFPIPILIVQHMPALFTRLLAQRLAVATGMPVHEGVEGALLRPGEIFVAPGGFHMEVKQASDGVRLHLHQGPPENGSRPAVDVLFSSVAQVFGSGVLCVVLTGMGEDGLRGCAEIREAGGQVLVQDNASSVVWGMPGAVARAGLAEKILPLDELDQEINRRVLFRKNRFTCRNASEK